MATLNLGRIKPVFRGAYSGSTAYVVDDIVTSAGSSYICIQAHGAGTQAVNQTAYWTQMAAGGTDVGTTLTTQGDILYRDGSGLQRLAKGTAGQVLKINTGATAPEWGTDVGGKIGQIVSTVKTDTTSVNATSFTDVSGMSIAITPSASTSKVLLMGQIVTMNLDQYSYFRMVRDIGGGGYSAPTGFVGDASGSRIQTTGGNLYVNPDGHKSMSSGFNLMDTPNTTSACTYKLQMRNSAGSYTTYFNRSASDPDTNAGFRSVSSLIAMEIMA